MEMTLEKLERHWMPFTSNRDFKRQPRMFVRASGMHYFDPSGRGVLDGSSGLFFSPAGHCRPEIAAAVTEQLQTLDYTPSFMRGHPAAFALADAVAKATANVGNAWTDRPGGAAISRLPRADTLAAAARSEVDCKESAGGSAVQKNRVAKVSSVATAQGTR